MTIIPDQPNRAHHQQTAVDALARLLHPGLPDIASWRVGGIHDTSDEPALAGQLAEATSFDVALMRLRQWAAFLAKPTWHIEPWATPAMGGQLAVRGTFDGVTVEVWAGIRREQVEMAPELLAELNEPAEAVPAEPARSLPQLAVSCPTCQAQPGDLCTSHSGTRPRRNDVHQTRRAAVTAEQAGAVK